jgi:hypothetical protein
VSARLLGLGLLLGGLLVYVGFALPARRAAADAGDEYRKAREQRREALQRLSRTQRLRTARVQAAAALAGKGAASPDASLLEFRRSVLSSLEGHGVSNVRLRVTPGRAPVAARVSLSADGPFADVVGLTGGLVRPGSGLVLDQVHIRPTTAGATLDLEALSLGRQAQP